MNQMNPIVVAYLSIGSNLGEKYDNCIRAKEMVDGLHNTRVLAVSNFYRTEPVDFLDQAWFVNGALKIETSLDPVTLMGELKRIEGLMGQGEKEVRFGPRIIDLDIVLYGKEVIQTENLVIPHMRMHKRCFVLKPLCDIGAFVVHPTSGKTVEQLLNQIKNDPGQEVEVYTKGDTR